MWSVIGAPPTRYVKPLGEAAPLPKVSSLGRVDKRDSLDLRPVIQALLHVGDELGAQPDI